MPDIEIEIDGKKCQAKSDSMVMQVADEAGIYIPRFCYHKHLTIAANCRMCLVEVEKSAKPLPACATPVAPGMKVFTRSAKAIAAQRSVMEFLLINHPLDCPICDQGGECELQDLSMGYGKADSYFCEGKRAVKDEDIGPLIETEMTRCIQCTRCVRFGDEVAGLRELGVLGRGEHEEISTYVKHTIHSEVSGNVIDLCPVGALTSKPFRYTARPWELDQYPSIAAHDCIGSNIFVHTRYGTVMRVVPRENIPLNQTWISDRDRFSYQGLYHEDRLGKPLVRMDGRLQEVNWQTALEFAANGLHHVIKSSGGDAIGALASPNSTMEEFFLLQKWLREIGSHNIDHRLRQTDFQDDKSLLSFPGLTLSLTELANCDAILLVGSNIQKEQPIAALRVRQAALKGAKVMTINMLDYRFHFNVAAKKIISPDEFVSTLENIVNALQQNSSDSFSSHLRQSKKISVLLGAAAFNHPNASHIRELCHTICRLTGASLGFLTEGANAAGAYIAGAIPKEKGLNAKTMLEDFRKAYVLLNVEPDYDCANPVAAKNALKQAVFVVSLSTFKNDFLEEHADVILPVAPFTETSGTLVNAFGDWQTFKGTAAALSESRPAWKVLRVLGNLFELDSFTYASAEDVMQEVKVLANNMTAMQFQSVALPTLSAKKEKKLMRIGEIAAYSIDPLVRRAKALQETQRLIEGKLDAVRVHPDTAKELKINEEEFVFVKQQDAKTRLPVLFDARVPLNCVFIPGATHAAAELPALFGEVEIVR